jgi:hypothetical protein
LQGKWEALGAVCPGLASFANSNFLIGAIKHPFLGISCSSISPFSNSLILSSSPTTFSILPNIALLRLIPFLSWALYQTIQQYFITIYNGLVLGRRSSCYCSSRWPSSDYQQGSSSALTFLRSFVNMLTTLQPGCPMHQKSADALNPAAKPKPAQIPSTSGCPVPHGARNEEQPKSLISQLNPLNYMFPDLSQKPAPNQEFALPTSRDESTIPKGSGDGNWEYPSPQQMYNALLRKGYTDTDITAVEGMVSVHNFLNEGAWQEILGWEQRFARGLYKGWQICKRGEGHVQEELNKHWDGVDTEPSLIRFQGRPKELTPKAYMMQVLGWVYPSKYG